ncbi:hypothetical protein [Cohnella yongneupensis]|uniref:Uncharacterized protein n=1 Tax=Cohnella yongneupensis TaxID=425006 RepID=A0ABW0QZH3_9BACL
MEKNQRFGKASKALFVVSLVLGFLMLLLSALAIILAAFKTNEPADDSLELSTTEVKPSTDSKKQRLIEATGSSKPPKKE